MRRLGAWAWRWGPCLAYMGVIFYLSAQSNPPRIGPDTYEHFFAYALLALLVVRALAPGGLPSAAPPKLALGWGLTTLYGVSDEIHQSFVPGRDASLKDLCQDALGALAALLALWLVTRRRRGEVSG